MERSLTQPVSIKEWAQKIAKTYNIEPHTVMQIYATLEGRLYMNGKRLTNMERTERFFKLYFDAIRKGDDNGKEQVD